jgi:hypothetical protein
MHHNEKETAKMKRQRIIVALLVGSGILAAGLITTLAAFVSPAHAQSSTTQRDAPTTRFYTPNGSSAGTASTYGNTTTFYDAGGHVTGRATTNNGRR